MKPMQKFLAGQTAHHLAMAKCHKAAMDAADEEGDTPWKSFHKAAMESHLAAGESCAECAKAADSGDLGKAEGLDWIPSQVSAVTPDAPQNLRPVFRTGQKTFEANQSREGRKFDFSQITKIEE